MSAVICPNCACEMRGSPCSVCGYRRQTPARYPIGHDSLTDSYLHDAFRGEPVEPVPPSQAPGSPPNASPDIAGKSPQRG